jgi:uncharacterized membrane protein YqhA
MPSPPDRNAPQPDEDHELRWADHSQESPAAFHKLSGLVVTSRFGIVLSILGVAISCFVMLIYCLVVLGKTIYHAFAETSFDMNGAKHLAVELIELTDFFLLGMVLYVVSIGMYQLFINPDVPVPGWMHVNSLNDLKTQFLNVIVVLLAVTFLGSIIYSGGALSAIIIALSLYAFMHGRDEH